MKRVARWWWPVVWTGLLFGSGLAVGIVIGRDNVRDRVLDRVVEGVEHGAEVTRREASVLGKKLDEAIE